MREHQEGVRRRLRAVLDALPVPPVAALLPLSGEPGRGALEVEAVGRDPPQLLRLDERVQHEAGERDVRGSVPAVAPDAVGRAVRQQGLEPLVDGDRRPGAAGSAEQGPDRVRRGVVPALRVRGSGRHGRRHPAAVARVDQPVVAAQGARGEAVPEVVHRQQRVRRRRHVAVGLAEQLPGPRPVGVLLGLQPRQPARALLGQAEAVRHLEVEDLRRGPGVEGRTRLGAPRGPLAAELGVQGDVRRLHRGVHLGAERQGLLALRHCAATSPSGSPANLVPGPGRQKGGKSVFGVRKPAGQQHPHLPSMAG